MATVLQQVISSALPNLIESIEVRSAFSPPVTLTIKDVLKAGPPNPVVKRVKPTIIIKGGIGQQVIAPGGVVGPDEWKRNVAIVGAGVAVAAVAGTMFLFSVGAFAGRRQQRKKGLGVMLRADTSLPVVFGIGVASSIVGGIIAVKLLRVKAI